MSALFRAAIKHLLNFLLLLREILANFVAC